MSKYVAKFRKDRDYNDDYGNYDRKKKVKHHNPAKKLVNYEYDSFLSEYDNNFEDYQKSSRKKARGYY